MQTAAVAGHDGSMKGQRRARGTTTGSSTVRKSLPRLWWYDGKRYLTLVDTYKIQVAKATRNVVLRVVDIQLSCDRGSATKVVTHMVSGTLRHHSGSARYLDPLPRSLTNWHPPAINRNTTPRNINSDWVLKIAS